MSDFADTGVVTAMSDGEVSAGFTTAKPSYQKFNWLMRKFWFSVRTDTATQGLTATQKANARANIGACINTNLQLYVSTSGNDTTGDGLSVGTAWATPHKAMNWLSQFKIMDSNTVTINVGAGAYNFTNPIHLRHPDGMRIEIVGATMLGARTAGADSTGSGDKLKMTGSDSVSRAADLVFNKAKIEARWATRFYFTGGSGGLVARGGHLGLMDKIALIANNSAATNNDDGHNACGVSNYYSKSAGNTSIVLGADTAIAGFAAFNIMNVFGGSIYANSATITGAGSNNCYNYFGGSMSATGATITGSGSNNCYNDYGGSINANSATITGAGSYNCFNYFGGSMSATGATIDNAGISNCLNNYGGSINANGATIDNAGGTGLRAVGSGSVIYYGGAATCSPALNTVGNGGAFIGNI